MAGVLLEDGAVLGEEVVAKTGGHARARVTKSVEMRMQRRSIPFRMHVRASVAARSTDPPHSLHEDESSHRFDNGHSSCDYARVVSTTGSERTSFSVVLGRRLGL